MKKINSSIVAFLLVMTTASAQSTPSLSEMSWSDVSPFTKLIVGLALITVVLWGIYIVSVFAVKEDKEKVEKRRQRSAPHYHAEEGYQSMTLANHLLAIRDERQKEKLSRTLNPPSRG